MTFDMEHGSPFDRGAADSHYGRPPQPHYYNGPTYNSDRIKQGLMTKQEIWQYNAGYQYNELFGSKKDYE